MSTVQVILLKNAGDSVTIGVESCKLMEIGKYPEVEFTGQDGYNAVAVRIPKASCDRQMERAGVASYEGFVGKIVTISRDPNKNDATRPYWGIKVSGAAPKLNGAPPAQRATIPDDLPDEPPPIEEAYNQTAIQTPVGLRDLFKLYDLCLAHARSVANDGDVAASTATLFIEANKRGIRA